MSETSDLTVFYDGQCPLCEREIGYYRTRRGADRIAWVDVSQCATAEVAPGLTKEAALSRFHVVDARGAIASGGDAFAQVWSVLPGFRPFGRLFRPRPLRWALNRAYDRFLGIRPRLQALIPAPRANSSRGYPVWLIRELRSDQAGETGAVAIYRGVLATTRNQAVRAFAERHLETEREHLALMNDLLPRQQRSRLLPLWSVAGFITGAVPGLLGPTAVFATVAAVEAFVDRHYEQQIQRLRRDDTHPEVLTLLERCQGDELHHRDEAQQEIRERPGRLVSAWCRLVATGSEAAVAMARRL